jgi:hypothetical protein
MVKKKFTTTKKEKGRLYHYFRKDGLYVRLPDDPSSEENDREYWRLMRGGGNPVTKLNFDKLITSYKQSPKWERLAPLTKSDYSKVLEYLHDTIGKKNPTKMRRSTVIAAQMANRHRARFANYIPHMLSILFEHAIDIDWQRDNPAKGIEKIKQVKDISPGRRQPLQSFAKMLMGYLYSLLNWRLALVSVLQI